MRTMWLTLAWLAAALALKLVHVPASDVVLVFAAAFTLIGGTGYALSSRHSLRQLARGFDRRLDLREQLESALEISDQHSAPIVAQYLFTAATKSLQSVRGVVGRAPRMPIREVETLCGVVLLIGALWLAMDVSTPEQQAAEPLPLLPTAPANAQQQGRDKPAGATSQPAGSKEKAAPAAIGRALGNTGATTGAANALKRGDSAGAAKELRDKGAQKEPLDQTAARALSKDLQSAADQLRPDQPDLAQKLDQIAKELLADPKQGLGDLARTLDGLGSSPAARTGGGVPAPGGTAVAGSGGPGSGAGKGLAGEHRVAKPSMSLTPQEAVALPTSAVRGGPRSAAQGAQGPSISLGGGGTGAAPGAGGTGSTAPVVGEADPLRIPSEDRDVVQNYFSPAP
ncbi:MAG: hypothetical protein NVS4B8_30510 [Herpetosiphon sp.]